MDRRPKLQRQVGEDVLEKNIATEKVEQNEDIESEQNSDLEWKTLDNIYIIESRRSVCHTHKKQEHTRINYQRFDFLHTMQVIFASTYWRFFAILIL